MKMKKEDLIHPKDWKWAEMFADKPDPDFDPQHNQMVIEKTIKEAKAMRRKKEREYDDAYGERVSAIARYWKDIAKGGKSTGTEKYFGKKYLAYLAGKSAIQRIQDKLTVLGKDGKVIRRPGES